MNVLILIRYLLYVIIMFKDGEDVSGLINAFCDEDFYKNDYQEITNYFSDDYVAYEDTIKQMRKLAKMIKEVT